METSKEQRCALAKWSAELTFDEMIALAKQEQEAYKKLPRIEQIEIELSKANASASACYLVGNWDGYDESVERIKSLTKEKAELEGRVPQ